MNKAVRRVTVLLWLVLQSSLLCADEAYYRSNEIAMPIERIAWYRADEFDYVLKIETTGDREVRTLLSAGSEIERLQVIRLGDGGRREVLRRDGEVIHEEEYNVDGRLVRRETFGDSAIVETMSYRSGRLSSSEIRTADGDLVSRDHFNYDSEGLLREVIRDYPSGDQRRSTYTFQDGALLQEWHGEDDEGMLIRYAGNGRIVAKESWDGEVLTSRESFAYSDSGVIARSTVTDFAEDLRVVTVYDTRGRAETEETTRGDEVIARVSFEYQGERLASRREESDAGVLEWQYTYEGSEIAEETLYEDGTISKRIKYPAEDEVVEERYRNGELFLRIYFDGGRRVREEVVRGGSVIQERTYE